jgi:hypothetical protein
MDAVSFSIEVVFGRIYELMTSTVLPFILIAVFLYILFSSEKIVEHKRISILLMILCACISLLLIAFPVALGYGGLYYHERCKFVQDVAMNIYLFVITIYSADYLKKKLNISPMQHSPNIFIWTILPIVLCFLIWHDGKGIREAHPLVGIVYNMVNGENERVAKYWESILDEIADSGNEEVIVQREKLESNVYLYLPGISENEDYWMNVDIANYYGKEKVTLICTE